ncbi:glycosyl transferase group 1 [Desulfovibrio sp. X2]|uniref:glycosyltransferase family 4 protein n=1 Tax=Desulfovibrio sp. X2 TaxID=941449 RepID=UPI000358C9D7|nr:glycosyltransferase family 4 protein [Desulfovibrio sp. X2]EPR44224.1 glycosyl transferase group 1 [Desulfovibrio sp. X2]
MKIIFLTSSSTASGGSRQAIYLARGLCEKGHDLTLFAPEGSPLPSIDPSVPSRVLPARRSRWRAAVEAVLPAKNEPVVVHAFHNKACKLASLWGLVWKLSGRKSVVLLNRGVCYRPGNPLPWWSPGVDAVTVNSMACAKVLARIGTPRGRLRVIYNGVPPTRVSPARSRDAVRAELGIPRDTLVVGSITGDKPVKGVAELVRGAALAKAEGFSGRLVLVGASPEKWTPLAEELGVAELFRFIPRTPAVADYLQIFDAFVISSLSESLPNTLLEACLTGLPVLSTAVGGVPELIEGRGLIVAPGDPSALSKGLLDMAADAARRERFAASSRELAASCTLERKVERTETLYRELLAARGFPTD